MKKFFSLMMIALLAVFVVSCKDDDDDRDTYSVVYDIQENFVNSSDPNTTNYLYGINKVFNSPLSGSDVVLIYRKNVDSDNSWQLLPKTVYVDAGVFDYTFNFTVNDIQIYADSNFNLSAQSNSFKDRFLNNQIFRVVLVPASSGKNANVDYHDYNSVIRYFKIDDSKVTKL